MPKRILYLTSSNMLQGGAELCLMKIVEHAKARGDVPLVVMPEEGAISEHYRSNNVQVRIVPYNRISTLGGWGYRAAFLPKFYRSIRQMERLICREAIDLVHVNELIDFNGLVSARRAGVPCVCHVRVIVEQPRWMRKILLAAARRYADRIICVSQAVRTKMFDAPVARQLICRDSSHPPLTRQLTSRNSATENDPVRVIYDGGPDLSHFDPARPRPNLRPTFGIPDDAFVAGVVSKLARVKGHDHFLEAAALMRAQVEKEKDNLYFVLVGGPLPGHEEYYRELQQLIRSKGLEGRVVETGARSDIPELLAMFDAFVLLPTYQDPFPGVVLEAMAMERPVVAYDSGGIREQFEDGRSGFRVPQGDREGVARALLELYRDPERTRAMGKAARQYLLSHFSLERHFRELDALYAELTGE